jgi:hypothetical protein
MPKYLKLGKYYEMTNKLDNYGAHRVKLGCIFFLYEAQRRSGHAGQDNYKGKGWK